MPKALDVADNCSKPVETWSPEPVLPGNNRNYWFLSFWHPELDGNMQFLLLAMMLESELFPIQACWDKNKNLELNFATYMCFAGFQHQTKI